MRTRQTGPASRAFTLIELLVVVSIIALLISLLLPALGQARRQGRIAKCVANMKQHAQGAANYSSQNQDRLPHGPEGPGTSAENPLGVRGQPATFFAVDDLANPFATNGWKFPGSSPMPVMERAYPAGGWWDGNVANAQVFDFYIPILGPYMVEGEGMAMLQEVFVTPSHLRRLETWQGWKDLVKANGGKLFARNDARQTAVSAVGTYMYSQSCLIDPRIFSTDSRGNATLLLSREGRPFTAINSSRKLPLPYKIYNSSASVSYPDRKVTFWLSAAFHDRVSFWWMIKGTTIPVAMADGSARVTRPFNDSLLSDQAEHAGPFQESPALDESGTQYPIYFNWTNGGIKGRDL